MSIYCVYKTSEGMLDNPEGIAQKFNETFSSNVIYLQIGFKDVLIL